MRRGAAVVGCGCGVVGCRLSRTRFRLRVAVTPSAYFSFLLLSRVVQRIAAAQRDEWYTAGERERARRRERDGGRDASSWLRTAVFAWRRHAEGLTPLKWFMAQLAVQDDDLPIHRHSPPTHPAPEHGCHHRYSRGSYIQAQRAGGYEPERPDRVTGIRRGRTVMRSAHRAWVRNSSKQASISCTTPISNVFRDGRVIFAHLYSFFSVERRARSTCTRLRSTRAERRASGFRFVDVVVRFNFYTPPSSTYLSGTDFVHQLHRCRRATSSYYLYLAER